MSSMKSFHDYMIWVAICLERPLQVYHFHLQVFLVTDVLSSVPQARDNTRLHTWVVVWPEIDVSVCVCLLPKDSSGQLIPLPFNQNVQERNLSTTFLFHRELNWWMFWVEVIEEGIQFVHIMGPQYKCIIHIIIWARVWVVAWRIPMLSLRTFPWRGSPPQVTAVSPWLPLRPVQRTSH